MAAAACSKRPLQLTLALLKPDAVAHPLVLEVRADRAAPHRSAPSGRPGGARLPPSRCASAHRPCMRPSSATASSSCAPRSCAAGGSRAAAFTGSTRVGGAGLRGGKEKALGCWWGAAPRGSAVPSRHRADCTLGASRAAASRAREGVCTSALCGDTSPGALRADGERSAQERHGAAGVCAEEGR